MGKDPGCRMPRKICLMILHPAEGSFNHALAAAYAEGAAAHRIRVQDLARMRFDPDFGRRDFTAPKPLEPDLAAVMADLTWCEHLVILAPMWWGGLPAKAKGLIDRAFLPGLAYDPDMRRHGLPTPLLAGRSARLVVTSDTPGWAFRWAFGQPLRRMMARQVLAFVGVRPMAFTHLSPVEPSTADQRARWLDQMRALGRAGV